MAGLIDHGAFKLSPSTSSFVMGPVAVWGRGSMEAERKGLERNRRFRPPTHSQTTFGPELAGADRTVSRLRQSWRPRRLKKACPTASHC